MSETKQEWKPGDRVVLFGTVTTPIDSDGDVLVRVDGNLVRRYFAGGSLHAADTLDATAARNALQQRDEARAERDEARAEVERLKAAVFGDAEPVAWADIATRAAERDKAVLERDAARAEVERLTRHGMGAIGAGLVGDAVAERAKAVLERDAALAELESIRFILNGDAEGLSAKAAVDQFTGVAARVARDLTARTAERDEARAEVERLKRGEPVDLDAVLRADDALQERAKLTAERDAARAQRDVTEHMLMLAYGTIAALRAGGVSE